MLNSLDTGTLYQVVAALSIVAVFSAASGMLSMKPKYRSTFFSAKTGYRTTQLYFIDNEGDDLIRSELFVSQLRHWKSIAPQVLTWTRSSWENWEETKPEWWTESLKRSIPVEFLPLNVAGGAQRPSTLGDLARRATMKHFQRGGTLGDIARRATKSQRGGGEQGWAEGL